MAILELKFVQEHFEDIVDNIERDGPHTVVEAGVPLGVMIATSQYRELVRIKRAEGVKKRATRKI
jgi:hypothetical protein